MAIKQNEFAQQAAYLASRAALWAGECANNVDHPNKPMRDEPLSRFVKMLRQTADMIEEMHTEEAE